MVTESFTFPDSVVIAFDKVGMVGEVFYAKPSNRNASYYFNIYILGGVGALSIWYTTEFEAKAMREVFCGQLAEYLDEHPIDE